MSSCQYFSFVSYLWLVTLPKTKGEFDTSFAFHCEWNETNHLHDFLTNLV